MIVHAAVFTDPAVYTYTAGCGKIGVWLFFSLSAFLLTTRLVAGVGIADYAVGRVLRIYPIFFIAITTYYIAGYSFLSAGDFWRGAAMLYGPDHFWTIPVEMTFYALLPALVWLGGDVQKRFGDAAVFTGTAVLLLAHQSIWPFWLTPQNSINVVWYLPAFIFGAVAALMRHRTARANVRSALVVSVLIGITVATPVVREALFGVPPTPYLMNAHVFFGFAFAVMIWAVIGQPSTFVTGVFDNALLRWMGSVSYPTYLFHWLLMHEALSKGWFARDWLAVPMLVAASFLLGYAIHLAIERPIERLRRSLRSENIRLFHRRSTT